MSYLKNQYKTRFNTQANINIVPYVDVMLVLIVILLSSVSSIIPSLINLPNVSQKAAKTSKPIVVIVYKDGELGVNNKKQSIEQIIKSLNEKNNPNTAIVIAGDKEAKYEYITSTMSSLKQAGFNKVGLLVKTNKK